MGGGNKYMIGWTRQILGQKVGRKACKRLLMIRLYLLLSNEITLNLLQW